MSVQSRLKSLEQRASARAARKDEEACACGYVEVMEGEEPTEDEARAVAANVLCFERHGKRSSHVGYNTIEVSPIRRDNSEGDDPPLAA